MHLLEFVPFGLIYILNVLHLSSILCQPSTQYRIPKHSDFPLRLNSPNSSSLPIESNPEYIECKSGHYLSLHIAFIQYELTVCHFQHYVDIPVMILYFPIGYIRRLQNYYLFSQFVKYFEDRMGIQVSVTVLPHDNQGLGMAGIFHWDQGEKISNVMG